MLDQYVLSASPSDKLGKCWVSAGFTLLALYLLILPVSGTTAFRNVFFFVLIIITGWLAIRRSIKLEMPIIWPWIIYAAIALISLTYAINVDYSLGEIKTEILYGFLAMVLGATWINNRNAFLGLIGILIIGNVILIIADVYFAYTSKNVWPVLQAAPFKIGVGKFSTYLLIVIPFIAAYIIQPQAKRYFSWGIVLLVLNIAALYFTTTRIAFICLMGQVFVVAGLLVTSKEKQKFGKKFYVILALLLAIIIDLIIKRGPNEITLIQMIERDSRWDLWVTALNDIRQRPFTGGGYGIHAFKLFHPEFAKTNGMLWHAHNTILNIGVQIGIPGILAFLALIGSVLYKLFSYIRSTDRFVGYFALAGIAAWVGFILKVQTDDFFTRDLALLFWLLSGALLQTLKNTSSNEIRQ